MLKQIWHDPVWSKVIAAAICGLFGLIWIGIRFDWWQQSHVQSPITSQPYGYNEIIKPPQPQPQTKPKPHIMRAGQPITVGDFTFLMRECRHTQQNWLACTGTVVNRSEYRASVTFTGASATDDNGHQYGLATYLVGAMAGLFFGAGSNSQELTPGVPVEFGFVLKGNPPNATAFNFDLTFITSAEPARSQITFTNIPILE